MKIFYYFYFYCPRRESVTPIDCLINFLSAASSYQLASFFFCQKPLFTFKSMSRAMSMTMGQSEMYRQGKTKLTKTKKLIHLAKSKQNVLNHIKFECNILLVLVE